MGENIAILLMIVACVQWESPCQAASISEQRHKRHIMQSNFLGISFGSDDSESDISAEPQTGGCSGSGCGGAGGYSGSIKSAGSNDPSAIGESGNLGDSAKSGASGASDDIISGSFPDNGGDAGGSGESSGPGYPSGASDMGGSGESAHIDASGGASDFGGSGESSGPVYPSDMGGSGESAPIGASGGASDFGGSGESSGPGYPSGARDMGGSGESSGPGYPSGASDMGGSGESDPIGASGGSGESSGPGFPSGASDVGGSGESGSLGASGESGKSGDINFAQFYAIYKHAPSSMEPPIVTIQGQNGIIKVNGIVKNTEDKVLKSRVVHFVVERTGIYVNGECYYQKEGSEGYESVNSIRIKVDSFQILVYKEGAIKYSDSEGAVIIIPSSGQVGFTPF